MDTQDIHYKYHYKIKLNMLQMTFANGVLMLMDFAEKNYEMATIAPNAEHFNRL